MTRMLIFELLEPYPPASTLTRRVPGETLEATSAPPLELTPPETDLVERVLARLREL